MKFHTILLSCLALSACGPPRLPPTQIPGEDVIRSKLELAEMPYITDDTWAPNPLGLLGQVVQIRKEAGRCPERLDEKVAEFTLEPVRAEADPESFLDKSVKRDSFVIDRQGAVKIAFLSYLDADFKGESVMSLLVLDQAAARVDDRTDAWTQALAAWKERNAALMTDPEVCYLLVVKGFVQKNVVRRTYVEASASVQGSYGVNVAGSYMQSSEDYKLDFRFGLSVAVLRRPPGLGVAGVEAAPDKPTASETALFNTMVTRIKKPEDERERR